tara:strand:- start:127 stop:384 length:258 start_codon:yes stop_codon:yes gene_type:complete
MGVYKMRYIESYEQRNGINDYEHFGALKGIPKKMRNPETIKLKLIQKSIKILKSKGLSSRDMEQLTTLIWDISTASYEQGRNNER